MHYIENLKICNFLSFFGEIQVNLKPLTAVMCNYHEGKIDFLKALDFVFGALTTNNLIDLVHEAFREQFLVNRNIQTYVEITVRHVSDKNGKISFRKTIKNGRTILRLEHKISGIITSRCLYEEKLSTFNLDIKQKNLFFLKNVFDSCIWGSHEDLEKTIITCLRGKYLLDEWKQIQNYVSYWLNLKNGISKRNYGSMKNTHKMVSKFAKGFKTILENRKYMTEKSVKNMLDFPLDENCSSSPIPNSSYVASEYGQKSALITKLEIKCNNLVINEKTVKLYNLKQQAAILSSHRHYNAIKIAEKSADPKVLENQVSELKNEMREKEHEVTVVWKSISGLQKHLDEISQKITESLIQLNKNQLKNHLESSFTKYGRFADYIQPSHFYDLLKQIIGSELFFANLCDTFDDAINSIKLIKKLKWEQREMFIIFENYTHHLKDLLTASGEKGVEIQKLDDLLIFLSKLAHFKLIDEVPVVADKNFNFNDILENTNVYKIYLKDNLHFTGCGLISRKVSVDLFCIQTQSELEKSLIDLTQNEELKFQELQDLIFKRCQIRFDMNHFENDINYLKQKQKKPLLKPASLLPTLYSEYADIFNESDVLLNSSTSETVKNEDTFLHVTDKDTLEKTRHPSPTNLAKDFQKILNEIKECEKELMAYKTELRVLDTAPVYINVPKLRKGYWRKDFNKSKYFFEKELQKLRKLTLENDIEEFLSSQEWETCIVKCLSRESTEINKKFKEACETSQTLRQKRKDQLYPLIKHCKLNLTTTFNHLIGNALPFIDLHFTPEEHLQLSSCFEQNYNNFVDIKHFNTVLKFLSVLALLLEMCMFDKIPLIILDDIEMYLPNKSDDYEAVIGSNTIHKLFSNEEHIHFQFLMRIGQFLSKCIEKNTLNISTTEAEQGPMQIIFFTTGDFIHAAKHYIWIHQQPPEGFTYGDSITYSGIHEINVDNLI